MIKFLKILSILATASALGCASQSKYIESNQIRTEKYVVSLSDDKESILISGHFDTGIYYNLLHLYKPNRDSVKNLIYNSYGGYLDESDQLFTLAKKNNLNTYAFRYWQSACMAAFLGGKQRIVSHNTKIGFHQYGTSGTAGVEGGMATRLRGRQYKDLRRYRKQGVSEEFLQILFKAEATKMWHPSANKLIKANVVHEYISRSKFLSFDTYDKSLNSEKSNTKESKEKQCEATKIEGLGYKITLSNDKRAIFIVGTFHLGISEDVKKIYIQYSNYRSTSLSVSRGIFA